MTIKEAIIKKKAEASPVNYRNMAIDADGQLTADLTDYEKRIIRGYALKWNNKNSFGEKVIKGACAKSIRDRGPASNANYKITLLWQHDGADPLAVLAVLKEDDYGLYFESMPLDDVPNAQRALDQIRSKTLNQISIGFNYNWGMTEYDPTDDSYVLKEIEVLEVSIVTLGADDGTYIIRSAEEAANLTDEIDTFIKILPRKDRLEASRLFALQKTLTITSNTNAQERARVIEDSRPLAETRSRKVNLSKLSNYFKDEQ